MTAINCLNENRKSLVVAETRYAVSVAAESIFSAIETAGLQRRVFVIEHIGVEGVDFDIEEVFTEEEVVRAPGVPHPNAEDTPVPMSDTTRAKIQHELNRRAGPKLESLTNYIDTGFALLTWSPHHHLGHYLSTTTVTSSGLAIVTGSISVKILKCLVYLSGHKTSMFADSLEVLGFEGSTARLRPCIKHNYKIRNWPTPTNRAKLDAFLWLTTFLRIFIPGRAQFVMQMKKAYLQQVLDEPKPKREHNDEMEDCDKDFTKPAGSPKSKRPTIRRKWIEKESFDWGDENSKPMVWRSESIHLRVDEISSWFNAALVIASSTRMATQSFPRMSFIIVVAETISACEGRDNILAASLEMVETKSKMHLRVTQ